MYTIQENPGSHRRCLGPNKDVGIPSGTGSSGTDGRLFQQHAVRCRHQAGRLRLRAADKTGADEAEVDQSAARPEDDDKETKVKSLLEGQQQQGERDRLPNWSDHSAVRRDAAGCWGRLWYAARVIRTNFSEHDGIQSAGTRYASSGGPGVQGQDCQQVGGRGQAARVQP